MSPSEQTTPQPQAAAPAAAQTTLLDEIIEKGFTAQQTERRATEELLRTLADEALQGTMTWDKQRHQDDHATASRPSTRPCRSSWPPSCTIPTSRSWRGPGAG